MIRLYLQSVPIISPVESCSLALASSLLSIWNIVYSLIFIGIIIIIITIVIIITIIIIIIASFLPTWGLLSLFGTLCILSSSLASLSSSSPSSSSSSSWDDRTTFGETPLYLEHCTPLFTAIIIVISILIYINVLDDMNTITTNVITISPFVDICGRTTSSVCFVLFETGKFYVFSNISPKHGE